MGSSGAETAQTKLQIKLNTLREAKGWTYDELADFLGVARSRAHDWCVGFRDPSTASLRKIAAVLGCSLDDLI